MKTGAIIAFAFAALGFLVTAQTMLVNPPLVRENLVAMVVFPGGLAALGVYLWRKAGLATAIDAEIVEETPGNPPD
jgi:hypothetical protein